MRTLPVPILVGLCVALVAPAARAQSRAVDPLPSWNDGAVKNAILAFVTATTDDASPRRVAPDDRVATFDQDGTLWVEHPLYTQAMFALARVRQLAPQHPEWKTTPPFATVLSGNQAELAKMSESDWQEIVGATHAGMSTEDFLGLVKQWLATAKHPRFGRPYTELVYQPMKELMSYLRDKGFKTYIVTGGGQEFVRAYAGAVYGVPPEQVIGSSIATKYEARGGKPALMREPKVFFVDDHGGKPVGINLFIGKRPLAAFGNSDGDAEMLQWTQAGPGTRLELLVHHDDGTREMAYGPAGDLPETKVGTFSNALMQQAVKGGWLVVSMKRDWKRIFSFEPARASSASREADGGKR